MDDLPDTLIKLKELEELYLGNNCFSNNQHYPSVLEQLKNLERLNFQDNDLQLSKYIAKNKDEVNQLINEIKEKQQEIFLIKSN